MNIASADSCGLCLGHVNRPGNSSKKSVNHLWSYLYYRNVRETVQVGVEGSLPKLTFSLSVGSGVEERCGGSKDDSVVICGVCCDELENLEKLHQELESVKKAIESQVGTIDARRKGRDPGRWEDSFLTSFVPKLEMSMAGAVAGRQNIVLALQFLEKLTDGAPCASTSSSQKISGIIVAESKEGETSSLQELRREATAEEFLVSPDMDPSIMKVEAQDIKISTTPIPNNELNHFELEGVSVPKTEADEGYLFLDQLPSTSAVITQDPLAGPLPPENVQESMRIHASYLTSRPPNVKLEKIEKTSCKICGRRIATNNMHRHVKAHSKVAKSYNCEICNKAFSLNKSRLRHQREHCGNKNKPFSCSLCHKGFARKENLEKHKRLCEPTGTS